jgi:hypothetical protein
VAFCLHPECIGLDVHYEPSITAVYQLLHEQGWSHWSRARRRYGWRCPAHAGYRPDDDLALWQIDDMRHKGRVQRAHVVFCGDPACAAVHFTAEASGWWSARTMRLDGWSHTRFGWRCPSHKRWWAVKVS